MEANETQPWTGNQRGESLHKLQGFHYDMGGPVVIGALELQHDLAVAIAFESFVGNGGPGDVAT